MEKARLEEHNALCSPWVPGAEPGRCQLRAGPWRCQRKWIWGKTKQSKAKRTDGAGNVTWDVLFRFLLVFTVWKDFLKGEDPTRRSLGRNAFSEAT